MKSVLVLGGTGFIGRHFVESVVRRQGVHVTLANRGRQPGLFPQLEQVVVNRDNWPSCQAAFSERRWDHVFDFSGTSYLRVLHAVTAINTGHYTFLSSSAVDLATPEDPLLSMAQEKLWCEHIVAKAFDMLSVRAAFVVGKYDNTGRFEKRNGDWCWLGTDNIVRPAIEAEQLVESMVTVAFTGHRGVLKAGYSDAVA